MFRWHIFSKKTFKKAVDVMPHSVDYSSAELHQYKWTVFCDWCCSRGQLPFKTFAKQMTDFFLYPVDGKKGSLLRSTSVQSVLPLQPQSPSSCSCTGNRTAICPCGVVVARLPHTQEDPGSTPGRGSYLRQVSLH